MISEKEEMRKQVELKQTNPTIFLDRRKRFALRYEMFNDNYYPQVKKHLADIYTKYDVVRLDKQLDMTNNIFKTIVKKISRVYSFGVNRTFTNEDTQMLYEDLQINKIMKEANIFMNAFNDVLLQVSWNYKEDKPRLIFRYPHKTKVELDEYDNPAKVEYYVSSDDKGREKWAYWTETEHYYNIYDKDKVSIEYPEDNENGVNPYGVLPFVFMQKGFRDGYFFDEHSGQDLIHITLDNSIYNTFKNYLIKWQSFKQLYVTGSSIGEFSGQLLDPSTALTASGDDVNIGLLDLTADLEQLDNTLKSSANNVAINYNISPSQFRMSSQISSGFALKMENSNLDEFTKEQQSDFIQYEKELFKLLNIVSETELGEMEIYFNQPKYTESKSIELDATAKEIDLGVTSVIEYIMNKYSINEEAAIEKLDSNLELRNKVYNKVNQTEQLNFDTTASALGL